MEHVAENLSADNFLKYKASHKIYIAWKTRREMALANTASIYNNDAYITPTLTSIGNKIDYVISITCLNH